MKNEKAIISAKDYGSNKNLTNELTMTNHNQTKFIFNGIVRFVNANSRTADIALKALELVDRVMLLLTFGSIRCANIRRIIFRIWRWRDDIATSSRKN